RPAARGRRRLLADARRPSPAIAVRGLSFFCPDTAPSEIYTLSLHDALPIFAMGALLTLPTAWLLLAAPLLALVRIAAKWGGVRRSEEHTSELQSLAYLVCRLLLEKKKN